MKGWVGCAVSREKARDGAFSGKRGEREESRGIAYRVNKTRLLGQNFRSPAVSCDRIVLRRSILRSNRLMGVARPTRYTESAGDDGTGAAEPGQHPDCDTIVPQVNSPDMVFFQPLKVLHPGDDQARARGKKSMPIASFSQCQRVCRAAASRASPNEPVSRWTRQ